MMKNNEKKKQATGKIVSYKDDLKSKKYVVWEHQDEIQINIFSGDWSKSGSIETVNLPKELVRNISVKIEGDDKYER